MKPLCPPYGFTRQAFEPRSDSEMTIRNKVFETTSTCQTMEKLEILKIVGKMPDIAIVSRELGLIEAFAISQDIPYEEWNLDELIELSFVLRRETLHDDGYVYFVTGSLPAGWTRTL